MLGIEVVCCSTADCRLAEDAGATRIELCSAIELGGLTPSVGLFESCRSATSLPIMVMIRPRPGGFCYSADEFAAMAADIRRFASLGAVGLVFGVLTKDGRLDERAMEGLAEVGAGCELVCHRACDVTPDLLESAHQLARLGFSRMLTGGGQEAAIDGITMIKQLVESAVIGILPGGHIRSHEAQRLVREAGVREVHLGPFTEASDPTSRLEGKLTYGPHRVLDARPIREIAALDL
jgi:copper homeostasis protein